ncbi:MAG: hypothetical protein FWC80_00165 [Firmicutes bacterium]|nr:hypothetical protein [Bacillota bacterium]
MKLKKTFLALVFMSILALTTVGIFAACNGGETTQGDPYVASITATFNQQQVTVSQGAPLSDLVPGLTVAAVYTDDTTRTLTFGAGGYTLSGNLNTATNTITVAYSELTATFTVSINLATGITASIQTDARLHQGMTVAGLRPLLNVRVNYADGAYVVLAATDFEVALYRGDQAITQLETGGGQIAVVTFGGFSSNVALTGIVPMELSDLPTLGQNETHILFLNWMEWDVVYFRALTDGGTPELGRGHMNRIGVTDWYFATFSGTPPHGSLIGIGDTPYSTATDNRINVWLPRGSDGWYGNIFVVFGQNVDDSFSILPGPGGYGHPSAVAAEAALYMHQNPSANPFDQLPLVEDGKLRLFLYDGFINIEGSPRIHGWIDGGGEPFYHVVMSPVVGADNWWFADSIAGVDLTAGNIEGVFKNQTGGWNPRGNFEWTPNFVDDVGVSRFFVLSATGANLSGNNVGFATLELAQAAIAAYDGGNQQTVYTRIWFLNSGGWVQPRVHAWPGDLTGPWGTPSQNMTRDGNTNWWYMDILACGYTNPFNVVITSNEVYPYRVNNLHINHNTDWLYITWTGGDAAYNGQRHGSRADAEASIG